MKLFWNNHTTMKKTSTFLLLFFTLVNFAQTERGKMREKIKAEKIAFMTQQLNLSATEAEKFWPIYNTFEASTENIKKRYLAPIRQKMRRGSNVYDAEANMLLDNLVIAENKMYEAKVKLFNDLKSAIPAKKIIKLKSVEDAFNRRLLERLKKFRVKRNRD